MPASSAGHVKQRSTTALIVPLYERVEAARLA
jgi:hypothetical protein